MRGDAVIKQAAVADILQPRRPFLLAPLELQLEMIVLVLLLGGDGAEDLAGDADGRLPVDFDDGVDLLGVLVQADGLLLAERLAEPGVPAVEVFAVEERGPAVAGRCRRGRRTYDEQTHGAHRESSKDIDAACGLAVAR